jgi:hypothetical protein
MTIKTIIYDMAGTGFYISTRLWNDANYAFRTRHETKCLSDWRWIGSRGWYGTEENKYIFDVLDKAIEDLDDWHYGEFMEVDITI